MPKYDKKMQEWIDRQEGYREWNKTHDSYKILYSPTGTDEHGKPLKEKKKKGTCGCGRSPTGLCIGWHSLTEEKYKEKKKKYEQLDEEKKKKNPFHARAIDGVGE